MPTIVEGIKKISDGLNKICMTICVGLLGGMVIITFVQIICRVFFTALSWSEEVARYLLIWGSFLGAGCVYKAGSNIAVLFVQDLLPPTIKKAAKVLVHVCCLVFFALAIYNGIRYMGMMGTQKSAALRIPMKYMYLSVPVGCAFMGFHALTAIFEEIFGGKGGDKQ